MLSRFRVGAVEDGANVNHGKDGFVPSADTIVVQKFHSRGAIRLIVERLANLTKGTCCGAGNRYEHRLDLCSDHGQVHSQESAMKMSKSVT